MFRSSNPAFNHSDVFAAPETVADAGAAHPGMPPKPARPNTMTINGTVTKTFFLLTACLVTATLGWELALPEAAQSIKALPSYSPWVVTFGGGILGFLLVLATFWFKPRAAVVTAPLYALSEGFFVGGISAIYAGWMSQRMEAPGDGFTLDTSLVLNAALATFGTTAGMLGLYASRIVKVTEKFKSVVIGATIGAVLTIGLSVLLSLLIGGRGEGGWFTSIFGIGPIGLAITGFLIVLASLNLLLDFNFIENGAKAGAPRWTEWLGAMGLMVTLVWLYVEFLRLLWMIKAMADD